MTEGKCVSTRREFVIQTATVTLALGTGAVVTLARRTEEKAAPHSAASLPKEAPATGAGVMASTLGFRTPLWL